MLCAGSCGHEESTREPRSRYPDHMTGSPSPRRRGRSLATARLAALTDTAAEFGEVEVSRPWAETIVAVAVAAGVAHFATGPGTVLAGAAAALLGAVGVNAVRRAEVRDLPMGTEVVLGGLIALAIAGVVRLVPTGIGAVIAITAGIGILRAVIEWELRLRRSSNGSLHRDRVVSLAVFTLVLFAASIGISALVPGIVTLPSTPSARPDPVGPCRPGRWHWERCSRGPCRRHVEPSTRANLSHPA